jgi:small neutral amino acid transporter SnatA (MarC family)
MYFGENREIQMNRAFLIIAIPAVLVITAYILLAVYAEVQLTYFRIAGGVIGFGVAIYLVNAYLRRHTRGADPR